MSFSRRAALVGVCSLPLMFSSLAALAQVPTSATFDAIVSSVRAEAAQRGVSQATLSRALDGVRPLSIEQFENNQPEKSSTITFAQYYGRQVTPATLAAARDFWGTHRHTLEKAERDYGVPATVILAILNIESRFGVNQGDKKMVPALLTLLRDVRGDDDRAVKRRQMFRENVIQALLMVDQGYDEILTKNSSWAGAIGPAQFMPASVRRYGVDVNGDGKVNMWDDYREIIPSIAHYLREKGWQPGPRWGRSVRVAADMDKSLFTDTLLRQVNKTPDEWAALGVKQADGQALPANNQMRAMLIAPNYNVKTGAFGGPFYLVYDNFRTTMEYNKSYRYALTVLQMADALSAGPAPAPQAHTSGASRPPAPYNQ